MSLLFQIVTKETLLFYNKSKSLLDRMREKERKKYTFDKLVFVYISGLH